MLYSIIPRERIFRQIPDANTTEDIKIDHGSLYENEQNSLMRMDDIKLKMMEDYLKS